jgi:hypothetical protein
MPRFEASKDARAGPGSSGPAAGAAGNGVARPGPFPAQVRRAVPGPTAPSPAPATAASRSARHAPGIGSRRAGPTHGDGACRGTTRRHARRKPAARLSVATPRVAGRLARPGPAAAAVAQPRQAAMTWAEGSDSWRSPSTGSVRESATSVQAFPLGGYANSLNKGPAPAGLLTAG